MAGKVVWLQPAEERRLQLDKLDLTLSRQVRASIRTDVVQDYARAMRNGAVFPPISVVYSAVSDTYYVVDGWHRIEATRINGGQSIKALVYNGLYQDAVLFAARCNQTHGIRRSYEDSVRVAELMLRTYPHCSNSWIARMASISRNLIAQVRIRLECSKQIPVFRKRVGLDGRTIRTEALEERQRTTPPIPIESARQLLNPGAEARRMDEVEQKRNRPLVDASGLPVPQHLKRLFLRVHSLDTIFKTLISIRAFLRSAYQSNDPLFGEVVMESALADLDRLLDNLSLAVLRYVCPYCAGAEPTLRTCAFCGGRGLISKFKWDNHVPKELKDLRQAEVDKLHASQA